MRAVTLFVYGLALVLNLILVWPSSAANWFGGVVLSLMLVGVLGVLLILLGRQWDRR